MFARISAISLFLAVIASCASTPTESAFNLGVAAYMKQNYAEAAARWTKEVANGNIRAMNNLGYLV